MKISTEIESARKLVGDERAVEYVAKAGFDAWDFSMFPMCRWDWAKNAPCDEDHPLKEGNYLAFARRLRQIGLDNGIVCNQAHAPFPSDPAIMGDYLFRAIECAAEVGAPICIIHPYTFTANCKEARQNIEFYQSLLPFAKQCGVKIATENMWRWNNETDRAAFAPCATAESFNEIIDGVNDESLVACLDIGHAQMMGDLTSAVDIIHGLGKRLKALHVHDNDCHKDLHQIPFSMKIDFVAVAKALGEIGYDGDITLECDRYLSAYTKDNALEGLKKMAESASKIKDMVLNK